NITADCLTAIDFPRGEVYLLAQFLHFKDIIAGQGDFADFELFSLACNGDRNDDPPCLTVNLNHGFTDLHIDITVILIHIFDELQIDTEGLRLIEGRGATDHGERILFKLDFLAQLVIRKRSIARKANAANMNFRPFCDAQMDVNLVVGDLGHLRTDMGKIIAFFSVILLQGRHGIIELIPCKGGALFEQQALADFVFVNKAVAAERHIADCRLFDHCKNETYTVRDLLGGHLDVIERPQGIEPFDILAEGLWHVGLPNLRLDIETDG